MEEKANLNSKRTMNTGNIANLVIFVILISISIWFFIRIEKLEKSVADLQLQNESLQSDVNRIDYDVDNIYSDVNWNRSRLDYVIPLAENANMWAHSH